MILFRKNLRATVFVILYRSAKSLYSSTLKYSCKVWFTYFSSKTKVSGKAPLVKKLSCAFFINAKLFVEYKSISISLKARYSLKDSGKTS